MAVSITLFSSPVLQTRLPTGKQLPNPEISGRLFIKIRSCKKRITVKVFILLCYKLPGVNDDDRSWRLPL